jgi:outer membrane usher protein
VFNVIYNQEPLQFGIRAKVDGDDKTYYIGDNGQLYVNVENDSGNIKFYLDDGLTCNASYDFPPTNDRTKILVKQLECR